MVLPYKVYLDTKNILSISHAFLFYQSISAICFTLKKISTYDSLFSQLKYLVKYSWREGESFSQID